MTTCVCAQPTSRGTRVPAKPIEADRLQFGEAVSRAELVRKQPTQPQGLRSLRLFLELQIPQRDAALFLFCPVEKNDRASRPHNRETI